MASTAARRPLPALIALLALLLLTAIVWWRVLHRDNGTTHHAAAPCPTASTTPPAPVTLPAQKSIYLQVLNSTNREGIATAARAAFLSSGFHSPHAAGNLKVKHPITSPGQIRYSPNEKSAATLVGYYLPGARLVETRTTQPAIVVVLGAKYSKVASAAEVQRELLAHNSQIQGAPQPKSTSTCSPS